MFLWLLWLPLWYSVLAYWTSLLGWPVGISNIKFRMPKLNSTSLRSTQTCSFPCILFSFEVILDYCTYLLLLLLFISFYGFKLSSASFHILCMTGLAAADLSLSFAIWNLLWRPYRRFSFPFSYTSFWLSLSCRSFFLKLRWLFAKDLVLLYSYFSLLFMIFCFFKNGFHPSLYLFGHSKHSLLFFW